MKKEEEIKALGHHIIIDYSNCACKTLSDPIFVEDLIKKAAIKMNATIVMSNFHHFSPLGVSGVLVIAESHITIHTWPEYDYVALDIFYCGVLDVETGLQYIHQVLKPEGKNVVALNRGILPDLI